jgi:DeoR/GlpR family transcriptional regulator of sugar metabolism
MSTNELIRVCRLTFSTAYHDLNRLSARGLVVSTHNGRERIYSSNVKSAKLVFDHAVWTYAIEFKDGRNQTWSSRHELMEV